MKKLSIPVGATVGKGPKQAVPCFLFCKISCRGVPDILVDANSIILQE